MKKELITLCIVSCATLSGCSADDMKEKSEDVITNYLLDDNPEYNDYKKNSNEDIVDSEGYYIDDKISEFKLENSELIHVSFASNSLLNVKYFFDSECKEEIDKKNCYLNPGDIIYAKVAATSLVQSNTYEFRDFTIDAFEDDQIMPDYATFNNEIITIPDDIPYKEISIIPNGAYKSRNLSFKADFKDVNGNTIPLSPVWSIIVGEKEYSTKSDNYSIEANEVFRVKAQYDSNEYYLIKDESEPECETYNDDDGTLTFAQYDAQNAVDNYKIVLGKKFDIRIDSVSATKPVTIWIDGKEYSSEFPLIASAKLGAEVRIESSGTIKNVGNTKNLTRLTDNGYVYAVYNEAKAFEFNPSQYTYLNGKVVFYDSGHNEITKMTNLNIGDVIYYIGRPDSDYTFNMGNDERKLTVDSNIEYILKNEFKFIKKQKLDLPQPEKGGKIVYLLNDEEINDDNSYFAAGTDKLTARFYPSERYKVNNLSDDAECIVSPSDHRIHFRDNDGKEVAIDNVFSLSSTQKANLTISLDDSVGTEIKFNIFNGTDTPINNKKSYVSKKFFDSVGNPLGVDDNKIIDKEKVETVSGIKIAVSDWSPLENEALRLDVNMKSSSKVKKNEIYYITTGSGFKLINTDSGVSDYYTDITIKISRVKGVIFNAKDFWYENGIVTVSYEDTSSKTQLENKEFVEKAREIRITLTADKGYKLSQIDNSKWNPITKYYKEINQYTTTCKFEDISKKIAEIKNKTKINS